MRSKPISLRMRARTSSPVEPYGGSRARSTALPELPIAPPLPERKLAAILAADVEGYSRLMHENEEAALTTLSAHRAIIDGLIAARRGHITGSAGDSVLAEFASIVDAVNCGVAIQQALTRPNAALAPERRMELRIGINVGDVMVQDGDVFGDGVNVAARLEALAQPGGICVSHIVREHVRDRVEYGFDDLGEQRVKNIARPLRVFRLVFDPDASPTTTDNAPNAPFTTSDSASEAVEITFWQSVEAGGTPAEYRAYLERYPNGSFAALAQARLGSTSITPARSPDPNIEVAFWNSVKDSADRAMFLAYLDKYPNGEFRSLAEIRARGAEMPLGLTSLSGLLKSAFSTDA
jgi:adenylate cyclase